MINRIILPGGFFDFRQSLMPSFQRCSVARDRQQLGGIVPQTMVKKTIAVEKGAPSKVNWKKRLRRQNDPGNVPIEHLSPATASAKAVATWVNCQTLIF